MKSSITLIVTVALLFIFQTVQVLGAEARPMTFVEILSQLTDHTNFVVSEIPQQDKLIQARSFQEAAVIASRINFEEVRQLEISRIFKANDKEMMFDLMDEAYVHKLVSSRVPTIVIVPGLLGEFIETRAFEEIFSRDSYEKRKWRENKMADAIADPQYRLKQLSFVSERLRQLVDVASIDNEQGQPLIKLVILRTHIGTLESVGENTDRAAIFNRRLEKYLSIDPSENLIFLGYSRGTPLGLEMLSQAQIQNLNYLKNVKAMVSYAGVVAGSALADITDDESTESGRLFKAAKKLLNKLETSQTIWDRPVAFTRNSAAISEFISQIAVNSEFNPDAFLKTAMSGDFKTIAVLIGKVSAELGLKSIVDFNGHVIRLKVFIQEILKSVDGLKTKNLQKWWQTKQLPSHVKYLSISAAMVDPDKSVLENKIFQAKIGYNDTLDDQSLQGNRRTYEKVTGIALNDSQVALHQSLFLPQVISGLGSQHQNLQMESLGLLQTHHWGVSLQTVNVMKNGITNPFPREKVLLALKAYLSQFETSN